MSTRAVGLDIGGETTRLVEARVRRNAFEIHSAEEFPTVELAEQLASLRLKGVPLVVGITGRDMILRMIQVPPVPRWQLDELMEFEVQDISEQSGDDLCADHELLAGAAGYGDDDLVLLALVRSHLVEQRAAEVAAAGGRLAAFTPNAVALYNAVVATDGGEGTVLVVSLRGGHTDIAIVEEGDLLFARNLSGGGDTITDAVADTLGVDRGAAEKARRQHGAFPAAGTEVSGRKAAMGMALQSALRSLVGMLQSTVALCRSQLQAPNLEIDRVLLCGPGARVDGLETALTATLGLPVARFDPTEGYVVGDAPALDDGGDAFAVATGLAMMETLGDTYRIEILPAAARRRRDFRATTLWLVLAAAALVVYLGFFGWRSAADADAALADRARLSREVERRRADRRTYERTVAEARELAAELALLEEVTAPGHGVLVVLDLLDAYLPDDLWITELVTERVVVPELGAGGEARPTVVVAGMGKELQRDLSQAVVELTSRLREHPSVAGVLPTITPDARGRFGFELRIDLSVRADEAREPPVAEAG